MNTSVSRRQFLSYSAMTAVGVMASACKPAMGTPEPTPGQVANAAPAPATLLPPEETPALPQEIDSLEPPWPWMAEQATDSSDVPTWTGEKLKLQCWHAHGTGGAIKLETSAQDVTLPEVARVAGVTIDDENSYDNAGQTPDVRLGMLAAADDWPHIVTNASMTGGIGPLAEAGKVYDLTDLIPQYMPSLVKKLPLSVKTVWEDDGRVAYKGRIYAVPMGLGEATLGDVDATLDKSQFAYFASPFEPRDFLWVRDDVVKQLYPQAKTQQEIVDLYMEQGQFSKEDVFDVPIKSSEDFIQFLYDIKELGLKEGGQEVSPFFVAAGQDNWALMVFLAGAVFGRHRDNNYFTYWDKKTKRVEYAFSQPFFKDELKVWNQLVRDGVAAKESLIDTNAVFSEKLNQGLYATTYAWLAPNNQLLQEKGKPYRYRKVYLDIPLKSERFCAFRVFPYTTDNVGIFKKRVNQEELILILRWLDYMASDLGEKMLAWGPRSAGLWEEADGKRVFKDKELEEYMVYGKESPIGVRYNLNNGNKGGGVANGRFMPPFVRQNRSKFHPAVTYDRKRSPGEAELFFSSSMVLPPLELVLSKNAAEIWSYGEYVPEAERAWKARQSFEDALLKTLTASNDAEFDKLYNDLLTLAESIGYTAQTLGEINRVFREELNAKYMDNLLAAGG